MTDYKKLCAELVDELEGWVAYGDEIDIANAHVLIDRARAALAQPEPEVVGPPSDYIDPEHTGSDREMLEAFYVACRSEGGTADEIHLRGLRAVLARWGCPAPVAAGEVAELVADLRGTADGLERQYYSKTAALITRAADLLEQRHPAPVPVSERPWERDGWSDEEGRCWWGRAADEFCNHDWHYATRAEVEEYCSDAMPQITLPAHALPAPSGEVE